MKRRYSLVLFILILSNSPSSAQQRKGDIVVTYGVTANASPRHTKSGTPKRKGTLGLNVRASSRLVFGATFDTFSSKKRADGSYITGIGNTTLSVRSDILNKADLPSVSVTYGITLPSASVAKGLGSGRVDHKLIGDVGKRVNGNQLRASFGYLFTGRKGKSGFTKTGLLVLSLDRPFKERFTSKNELDFASRADNIPSEIFAINQIVYKVNDRFSLRAGVRTGITPHSPRIGFTGGISINTRVGEIFK